ncbi:MAG TPA: hypothetical protein VJP79_02365 [Nitrososphaera sp.]|nr:hypothetical protein [Nitrososphaera sp.]
MLEEKSHRLNSCAEEEFAVLLDEIGGLLNRIDPPSSLLMQAVDAKGQDYATYYYSAFSDTADLDQSLTAYSRVKSLVRMIVLMDRYFEVGNMRYRRLGEALTARLKKEDGDFMADILKFNLRQFWPFWKFEHYTKKLMINGHRFSDTEVKCFNLFKSSDASLIYAPVLEKMLPRFTRNASLIIHYNQALQDIEDDLDDIQEDLHDQMPNIFILSSLGANHSQPYQNLYRHRLNGAKLSILENGSPTVLEIVDDYTTSVDGIAIPNQFKFLKYLSKSYSDRIRKKIELKIRETQKLAAAPQ